MKQKGIRCVIYMLAALGMLFVSACGKDAEKTNSETQIELDLSHHFPPNHEQETVVVQEFIQEVKDATDGKVRITSYPGASLAAPDATYDSVATGAIDVGLTVHSYTPNQFPLTSIMELPFISKSGVEGSQLLWKLYEEFPELQAEHAETVPLWLATSEPGQLFTVHKQVKSIEDLKGMRIRSPSPEVNEWLTALGATPVSMSMTEVYEALERGVVDGTLGPWHTLLDHSLQDVVNYVTVGDFYMSTFFSVMSKKGWDSLGTDNQHAIAEIIGERMAIAAGENFDKRAAEAKKAATEKGIRLYELNEAEMVEWAVLIEPVIEKWIKKMEDKGLPGEQMYNRALELSKK